MALSWLTSDLDQDIRAYAKWLSPDDGEDGYHEAIVTYLTRTQKPVMKNPRGYWRLATKHNVWKIWRNAITEQGQLGAYLRGEVSGYLPGLLKGRQQHTHCRQGHAYTEENSLYRPSNPRARRCKQCLAIQKGQS